jgi:hypothetical protein
VRGGRLGAHLELHDDVVRSAGAAPVEAVAPESESVVLETALKGLQGRGSLKQSAAALGGVGSGLTSKGSTVIVAIGEAPPPQM